MTNFPQKAGDKVTIALEKHSNMVYRICLMYLKSKAEAEDAFQDVFLKLLQSGKQFESDEHEKAWLCTVAFNRCKDILKSFRYRLLDLDSIPEIPYETKHDKTLLEAVLSLPSKYKDVIYLHYYEEYTAGQIAAILKCKENTVYSQLSRARLLLKERLGEEYEY